MALVRYWVRNYGTIFYFFVLVRYGFLVTVRNYGTVFLSIRNYDIYYVPYRTATLASNSLQIIETIVQYRHPAPPQCQDGEGEDEGQTR